MRDYFSTPALKSREDALQKRLDEILKQPIPETPLMAKVRKDSVDLPIKMNRATIDTPSGRVVRLASGGPMMTVIGHNKETEFLEVVWITEAGVATSMGVPPICLIVADR